MLMLYITPSDGVNRVKIMFDRIGISRDLDEKAKSRDIMIYPAVWPQFTQLLRATRFQFLTVVRSLR